MLRALILAMFLLPWLGCAGLARAGESHPAGVPGGPAYVRLPPISLSVIGTDNRIDKEVSVMADLELGKDKTEQDFEPYRRSIMDAFLVALTGLYEDDNPTGQVTSDAMKQRLLEAAQKVTGPDFVSSVLLISVGERNHH